MAHHNRPVARWFFLGDQGNIFLRDVLISTRLTLTAPLASMLFVVGCTSQSAPTAVQPSPDSSVVTMDSDATEAQVAEFCGSCHKTPLPEHLPRRSWSDEVAKAYRRADQSGRKDLSRPDQQQLINYFTSKAPEWMVIPDAEESSPGPIRFEREFIDLPKTTRTAAISFLLTGRMSLHAPESPLELLSCNMEGGEIDRLSWANGKWSHTRLAVLKNPDHIVACDFDRDGNQDYLVAELGTLNATDDLAGRVTLLRSTGSEEQFQSIPLKHSFGRVADARVADLDGDGDDDFIIAEFGFEKTGRLVWLECVGLADKGPSTVLHVMDSRHGSIHAPPVDLDGDGDLDVIALFSQEYESIVAFMNDGNGTFTSETLFEANTPSFGSSGLELTDLDGDGDVDILFTNGDTLDKFQLRPFHGIHWLENTGASRFDYHHLTNLPGAVKAIPCDVDGDHDLDIVAVAYCPPELKHQARPKKRDTLIWLKQVGPNLFERHSLNQSGDGHMSVMTGDFNHDGRPDIIVGETSFDPGVRRWLTVYWNLGSESGLATAAPAN